MTQNGSDPVVFLRGHGLRPEIVEGVAVVSFDAPLLASKVGVALRHGQNWFGNERVGVARAESVSAAKTRFLSWCHGGALGGRAAWLCGVSNLATWSARVRAMLRAGRDREGAR